MNERVLSYVVRCLPKHKRRDKNRRKKLILFSGKIGTQTKKKNDFEIALFETEIDVRVCTVRVCVLCAVSCVFFLEGENVI